MDVCFEEVSMIAMISEKVKIFLCFYFTLWAESRRGSPAQVSDFSTSASGASLDFAVRRFRPLVVRNLEYQGARGAAGFNR
jgi:hypothetical protein